jgi:hypothetical protein
MGGAGRGAPAVGGHGGGQGGGAGEVGPGGYGPDWLGYGPGLVTAAS